MFHQHVSSDFVIWRVNGGHENDLNTLLGKV